VNRRAEPHIDPMMVYVVLEVPDPVVTGRIFSVTTVARTIPGHRRHPRRRVEPQPVVTGSPARADPVAPFEHNRPNARTAQGCRGCEPGRTRAADDGLRHGVIVIADAIRPSASGVPMTFASSAGFRTSLSTGTRVLVPSTSSWADADTVVGRVGVRPAPGSPAMPPAVSGREVSASFAAG
jgi:hypothetical protein